MELLGIRPGSGPVDPAELAAFTEESAALIRSITGEEPDLCDASTDSNIPLSLGIPANTIGAVRGGLAHTREEWIAKDSLTPGLALVLALMLHRTDPDR